jgi:hypothetical protein
MSTIAFNQFLFPNSETGIELTKNRAVENDALNLQELELISDQYNIDEIPKPDESSDREAPFWEVLGSIVGIYEGDSNLHNRREVEPIKTTQDIKKVG